jgi:hypothetical protein
MIERLSGASLLLILPADNLESSCYSGQGGVTQERVLEFNEIARSFTTESLKYLDLGVIMTEGENKSITDVRHYPREIWQKVSQFTQDWFSTYDSV